MNVFYAPIPRAVWPKKPIIAESALVGSWLKKSDILSGLPPGLFGYGYLNFGWIGVVLFAGITGIVISRFYFWCIARYTSNGKKVPNGSVLIYSLFYFLITNPISTEVQVSILIQVPFLLLIFFNCRSNSKS
jgi:oligosaccharide repeat unit polymerase